MTEERHLYLELSLLDPKYAGGARWPKRADLEKEQRLDHEIVEAVEMSDLRERTHLDVVIPSPTQEPNGVMNPLVTRLAEAGRRMGLKIVLGEQLFPAWGPNRPNPRCHFHTHWYRHVLSTLHEDARLLGADGTLLHCEPYGDNDHEWLSKVAATDGLLACMFDAVTDAVEEKDEFSPRYGLYRYRADYVYPGYSTNERWGLWPLTGLGEIVLCKTPYYIKLVSQQWPPIRCPDGMEYLIQSWGSRVGKDGGELADPGNPNSPTLLSIAQAKGIAQNLFQARERAGMADCWVHWAYPGREDAAEIIKRWSGA